MGCNGSKSSAGGSVVDAAMAVALAGSPFAAYLGPALLDSLAAYCIREEFPPGAEIRNVMFAIVLSGSVSQRHDVGATSAAPALSAVHVHQTGAFCVNTSYAVRDDDFAYMDGEWAVCAGPARPRACACASARLETVGRLQLSWQQALRAGVE